MTGFKITVFKGFLGLAYALLAVNGAIVIWAVFQSLSIFWDTPDTPVSSSQKLTVWWSIMHVGVGLFFHKIIGKAIKLIRRHLSA